MGRKRVGDPRDPFGPDRLQGTADDLTLGPDGLPGTADDVPIDEIGPFRGNGCSFRLNTS